MTTDLLETITQIILEELRAPDDCQLVRSNSTTIRLSRPRPLPYFYIAIEHEHITITACGREDTTIPYANPDLIETIQKTMDEHINRMDGECG